MLDVKEENSNDTLTRFYGDDAGYLLSLLKTPACHHPRRVPSWQHTVCRAVSRQT